MRGMSSRPALAHIPPENVQREAIITRRGQSVPVAADLIFHRFAGDLEKLEIPASSFQASPARVSTWRANLLLELPSPQPGGHPAIAQP